MFLRVVGSLTVVSVVGIGVIAFWAIQRFWHARIPVVLWKCMWAAFAVTAVSAGVDAITYLVWHTVLPRHLQLLKSGAVWTVLLVVAAKAIAFLSRHYSSGSEQQHEQE